MQKPPRCLRECATDADCDPDAHCAEGDCRKDATTAGSCTKDSECNSGNCQHGVCCDSDDCCSSPEDCDPALYSAAATCDDPGRCQGSHGVAACVANRCTLERVDDDSACNLDVVADECGGTPVKCRGGDDQPDPPPCASGTCGGFGASSCNPQAFCLQGQCTPDRANGESCSDDGACQSAHCANGMCCAEGDCCTSDEQCSAIKICDNRVKCQGTSQLRHCDVEVGVCVTDETEDDDSACAGVPSTRECGRNWSPLCGSDVEQEDAPACGRCANATGCAAWGTRMIGMNSDGTPATVPVCEQPYDVAIGCEFGASCDASTGICS